MARSKIVKAAVLILTMTFAISIVALPVTYAHTPTWNVPTFAYVSASPNPIGVGQQVFIVMWIDKAFPGAAANNDIRPHDYTLTITKPDGKQVTQNWPIVYDSTSSQYYLYTPDIAGNYTIDFDYGGQVYTFSGAYQNDTFLPSNATTTLTVQSEAIPGAPTYPLPSEYWTRPIESQNTQWEAVASNWLGSTDYTVYGSPQIQYDYQPNGTAPNTAHIMWTKPINSGGLVGGSLGGINGNQFYTGSSYNERFSQPIIMNGKLYYQVPYGNSASGGGYTCVDLHTGKTLWTTNTTGIGDPAFGYYYTYESPNQHGVLPNGLLVATGSVTGQGTVWRTYDPDTGIPTTMNITNVPSGTQVYGPSGETLTYVLSNLGNASKPNYYLAQWNSSRAFGGGSGLAPANWYSGRVNASLATCYDWNITVPWLRSGSPTVVAAFLGDILLGRNGSLPAIGANNPYTYWAISLKPSSMGQMLWMKTYDAPLGNITVLPGPVDQTTRRFALAYKEVRQWVGFNLDTGEKVWGPTASQNTFSYYTYSMLPFGSTPFGRTAYGRLYTDGYGGVVYCYDMSNGNLLWTYGNGGAGNSTYVGLEAVWPNWPLFTFAIADGKLYLGQGEHSMNVPIYKGELLRCIDAYTGEEKWTIMHNDGYRTRAGMAVADGYMVDLNRYDEQLYCFGKGPTATTVEAPKAAITLGSSLVISGTVIDIAAGTQQEEQAARFPHGVPAVSDESMTEWMEYVYMQKPRPTDVTGVEVTLSVLDANNNYREIGKTTANSDGFFTFNWKPDIEGQYTVYASFAGSESYWPSHAVSSFAVDPTIETQTPAYPQPVDNTMTIVYAALAIIITIIVAMTVAVFVLRKR